MNVAELLSDESKWCKGKAVDGQAKCLGTAILRCYEFGPGRLKAIASIRECIPVGSYSASPHAVDFIIAFNDHPDTTFEMVRKVVLEAGV